MLRSILLKLQCPTCWRQDAVLVLHVFQASETAGAVRDGVLVCDRCEAWYSIDDHLLDLEPPGLRDESVRSAFRSAFRDEFEKIGLTQSADGATGTETGNFEAQWKQRQHFDASSESDWGLQPFWRALSEITLSRWSENVRPESHLLDVGCANGRCSFYWVRQGVIVTGFDVSRNLIRQAIQTAQSEGLADRTTFFVGDGRHPPLKNESFDNAMTYGVLHHLPEPGAACREIQRVLVKGGTHFGSENNRSLFRGVFDALMKLAPIWHEEAGEQPLMSRAMLHAWTEGLPVQIEARATVYLPPHLCNWLGMRASYRLLQVSDGLAARIPGLREQGGLLVFKIQKV